MDTLLHRFEEKIKGVLEGFDRIIFKGLLFTPLNGKMKENIIRIDDPNAVLFVVY